MVFMFMDKNLLSRVIHESIGNFLLERNSESGQSDAKGRRDRDQWNLENLHSGDEGSQATALFNYLVENGDIDPSYDVYDIIYDGSFYDMGIFSVVDNEDTQWIVGTEDQTYESAKDDLRDMLDAESIDTYFSMQVIEGAIDYQKFNSFVQDYMQDVVNESPEDWLSSEERELTEKQEDYIKYLNFKLQRLPSNLNSIDSDQRTEVEQKIIEINELIEEIESDPQGEFSDEKIEAQVESMYSDYKDDPENFFESHYGEFDAKLLERLGLIDIEELITTVVDGDGPDLLLSRYDGKSDQIKLFNDYYTIIRYN